MKDRRDSWVRIAYSGFVSIYAVGERYSKSILLHSGLHNALNVIGWSRGERNANADQVRFHGRSLEYAA